MSRLCIRVALNDHPTDPALTPLRTNVGDVVELVNDDHKFSYCEENNGQYRMVDVPGVAQENLTHLKDHIEDKDGQMIQRRRLAVDHNADWGVPPIPDEAISSSMFRDQYLKDVDTADRALTTALEPQRYANFLKGDAEGKARVAAKLTDAALLETDPKALQDALAKAADAQASADKAATLVAPAQDAADLAVPEVEKAQAALQDAKDISAAWVPDPIFVDYEVAALAAVAAITFEKPLFVPAADPVAVV